MSTHRIRCKECGLKWDQGYHGLLPENWRDSVQFQCSCLGDPENLEVVITPKSVTRIRHGMKGDMHDYREDLAAFPNDPEAHVDGPRSLQKLKDKRLRQGWTLNPIENAGQMTENKEPENLAAEAFEEAKASGFRLESDA